MSANPFAIIRWAQRQTGITNPVHANTLVAIAIDSDRDGVCYPSQERIAAAARYSVRAVRMAIAWLEAQGYLRREERRRPNGSRTSDRILLALDRDDNRQEVPVVPPATGTSARPKRNLTAGLPAGDSGLATLEGPGEEPGEESSEPDGSGPGKPAPARGLLFSEGRPALVALGVGQREAGAMIGRWLRDAGDDAGRVLDAIRRARDAAPHAPIPWITAHLKAPPPAAPRPAPAVPRPRPPANGAIALFLRRMGTSDVRRDPVRTAADLGPVIDHWAHGHPDPDVQQPAGRPPYGPAAQAHARLAGSRA